MRIFYFLPWNWASLSPKIQIFSADSLWVNHSGLLLQFSILQNIVTSSKCLVTRALRDRWIWFVTVLWWRHNILEYRKYTEICHQHTTHSYLIVQFRSKIMLGNKERVITSSCHLPRSIQIEKRVFFLLTTFLHVNVNYSTLRNKSIQQHPLFFLSIALFSYLNFEKHWKLFINKCLVQ